ncbi:choline O-acetyltransferase [Anopheles ziemanni]|uniref:choline O-acetyltransferase n=1 Tax=Anopheles coustani TaxID=139045 RepID=UPI002658A9E9|nr:choline O-acetyltransferase [Anopheles coustani]XP_058173848.1 choline O-acetyltransferase [Anopheles ziemanni]
MLPKVPLPTLEQTTTEYLRILQPIVTPQQLERTRAIIRQFSATIGPALQDHLQQKRDAEDNWAYHYWLNDMYMDNPLPLPINSNPGMVMPPRRFTTVHDLAQFAAQLIDQLMDHKEMLESGALKQERATSREKGQPLCMAQYYRLLGSCRRPGDPRDSQYLPPSGEQPDAHVIVCCRKHMYCLPVKAGDRGRLNEQELTAQLLHVLNEAPCLPELDSSVGILTTEPRPQWAADREMLLMDESNARNIELIETALVVVCVDEPLPLTYNARGFNGSPAGAHYAGGRDESNMAHEMVHGGGSGCNTANRWFDKTMQLIICSDGTWGLCYEHSPSEGIAVVQLLEGILKKIDEGPAARDGAEEQLAMPQSSHLPPPERLEWVVRPEIEMRLREAARSIDRRIEDLDFYVYRYKPYGKNFIKACQVSPDVFIQLALQLAYYKLYGHLVSTYESASTRRFLLGRVDCIRSASMEALEWAKAMCQGEGPNVTLESDKEDDYSAEAAGVDVKKVTFSIYSRDHLRELFRCAAARQTEVMVQNILGYGIDIHLLGLREACREREGTMHELFTDECYKIANCFLLSTSQVACTTNSFMGYGPVTPHGYGASYNPHPNEIIFCISAFFTSDKTSASRFARSLQDSLDAMRDLLS